MKTNLYLGGRSGLRIRGQRGCPMVKDAYVQFAKWLRKKYEFPVLLPVYLSPKCKIVTVSGEECTASFFYPFNRHEEPFIRIATGDYDELQSELGRNDALASMICSLSHEVIHYFQWLKSGTTTERGVVVRATNIVRAYSEDVDCP